MQICWWFNGTQPQARRGSRAFHARFAAGGHMDMVYDTWMPALRMHIEACPS